MIRGVPLGARQPNGSAAKLKSGEVMLHNDTHIIAPDMDDTITSPAAGQFREPAGSGKEFTVNYYASRWHVPMGSTERVFQVLTVVPVEIEGDELGLHRNELDWVSIPLGYLI